MKRPPIVTVMGHVDHGKTSLLDALRDTSVVDSESGGITQHIGASQITIKDKKITFIDTPGHAAFTEMRSRGGKAADIVILVVAANDGVMPQTKEAISHAKASGVPIIVAINKIDLPNVNTQKVKNQLLETDLQLEEFGGDVIAVEVSATEKTNLDKLLESVLAVWELSVPEEKEVKELAGFVLESKHDAKKGYTATLIVTSGSLSVGQEILIGKRIKAKIKSITDFLGKKVTTLNSGDPGEILGLKDLPDSGETFELFTNQKIEDVSTATDDPETGKTDGNLNIVLRADTQGTLEALVSSLEKLEYEDNKINFLLKGVGDVKENDLLLASVSKAIIVAFKVNVPKKVTDKALDLKVLVRKYDIIYELIEELEGALEGLFEIKEEKVKGRAEILKLFPLPSGDVVAGCLVTHGRLRDGDSVSIRNDIAEDTEVLKTKIKTLKKASSDVKTVGIDNECGVMFNSGHEKLAKGMLVEVL